MIRLIGSKEKLLMIVGHKKFSFLDIYELSLIQQERLLFGKEIKGGEWGDEVHNSGERKLTLYVASEEELDELCRFFKGLGFRVLGTSVCAFPRKKRVWLDPKKITLDGGGCTDGRSWFSLDGQLTIRLYRKELKKFLEALKILSKEYQYRSDYDDRQRHLYYYCRKPITHIIK